MSDNKIKVYELRGMITEEEIIKTQFLTRKELEEYKKELQEIYSQDLTFVEEELEIEVNDDKEEKTEPNKQDWLKFEQKLFSNKSLFLKFFNSKGNGFSFLMKVLTDGKTSKANQTDLLFAIEATIRECKGTVKEEDITFLNEILKESNFSIEVNNVQQNKRHRNLRKDFK